MNELKIKDTILELIKVFDVEFFTRQSLKSNYAKNLADSYGISLNDLCEIMSIGADSMRDAIVKTYEEQEKFES